LFEDKDIFTLDLGCGCQYNWYFDYDGSEEVESTPDCPYCGKKLVRNKIGLCINCNR